jgi:hypothetical protein
MWMKSRKWREDPAGVQLPDRDALQADACGPTYAYAPGSAENPYFSARDRM